MEAGTIMFPKDLINCTKIVKGCLSSEISTYRSWNSSRLNFQDGGAEKSSNCIIHT